MGFIHHVLFAIPNIFPCRQGKLLKLSVAVSPKAEDSPCVSGQAVLDALTEEGLDFGRFNVYAYDLEEHGNFRIEPTSILSATQCRDIRVMSRLPRQCALGVEEDRKACLDGVFAERDGYFGIGIVRGKTEGNHGTLWRSAFQMGAAFVFTVGASYRSGKNGSAESNADVTKIYKHVPMFSFENEAQLTTNLPYSVPWVGIELGGTPLHEFEHPERAVYLLGSEGNGLPSGLLKACQHVVTISSERYASFNVSVAGSIVMYDRHVKRLQKKNSSELSKIPKDETRDQSTTFL